MEYLATSLKDVYEIADGLISAGVSMAGRGDMYPEGLFRLADEPAEKMARSLIQINDTIPKAAEATAKYVTPLMLASTFLMDLAAKGVILYGIFKAPKPSH